MKFGLGQLGNYPMAESLTPKTAMPLSMCFAAYFTALQVSVLYHQHYIGKKARYSFGWNKKQKQSAGPLLFPNLRGVQMIDFL